MAYSYKSNMEVEMKDMIDEHEWRSVLQVAQDGTFSLAAQHLFISQPSLSQCIKKIEGELGTNLFDRSQTPVTLTEAGRLYVQQARKMQRLHKELVTQTADLAALRTGHLVIGSSRTRSICYLMQPILEFHRMFPGIRLTVLDNPVCALREAVLQGQVDFVLLYAPLPEKQFQTVPLLKERVLLAVPMDSPLAQPFGGEQPVPYPQISFAKLEGMPFIKLQAGRVMTDIYEDLCRQTGTSPDIVLEASTILGAAHICSEGLGATLVTDMIVRRWGWSKRPLFFELEESVPHRELVAAYGAHQHLSLAARQFIGLLQRTSV